MAQVSDAEMERMVAERLREVGPVQRRRFVPRHLAVKMGEERAARWLDEKDAEQVEARERDDEVFGRLLGL